MRHCERSEAIQEIFYGFYGLLRRVAPRNDGIRSRNKVRDHMSWCIPTATCHRGKPKVCPRSEKKAAFTLAEVLITLGVIGIVAAMTLPMLIEDYKKVEIPIRLKKFYSTMQQAINLSIADNGPIEHWEFPTEQTNYEQTNKFFNTYLKPYLAGIKECGLENGMAERFCNKIRNNMSENTGTHGYLPVYIFADGSCFEMTTGGVAVGISGNLHFTFDYNCLGKPNKFDQDLFVFFLHFKNNKSAKLYAGNYVTSELTTREEYLEACKNHYQSTHYKGTCSALIQYDGWEIRDDYPWW